MSGSANDRGGRCEEIRELIAWYPTRTLDKNERRLVEEHAAGCEECADLLLFTADIKEALQVLNSAHPEPDTLVSFVENKNALEPATRAAVSEHLAVCTECGKQADMLKEVDGDFSREDVEQATASRLYRARPVRFWRKFIGEFFKPVPAAVYLVVAVVAVGMLVFNPGGGPDTGAVEGVVIIPDETDRVRNAVSDDFRVVKIDAGERQFLLLELTGIEAPPPPDAVYTIEIKEEADVDAAFTAKVEGRVFADNYAIYLPFPAGTLEPGYYTVMVTAPDQSVVFRSKLEAY